MIILKVCVIISVIVILKRCVMLPTVESFDTEATACVPVVAEPKCDKVGSLKKFHPTSNGIN